MESLGKEVSPEARNMLEAIQRSNMAILDKRAEQLARPENRPFESAETCGCGAAKSIRGSEATMTDVHVQMEHWRDNHPCTVRDGARSAFTPLSSPHAFGDDDGEVSNPGRSILGG